MIKLKIDLKLNGPGSVRVLYFIWLKSLVRFDSSKRHLINIIIQSPAAFWPKGNIVTKSYFSVPNSLFSINPLSYLVLYFRTVSTPHAHNFLQLTLSSLISHFHFHFHFLTSIWDLGSTVPSPKSVPHTFHQLNSSNNSIQYRKLNRLEGHLHCMV